MKSFLPHDMRFFYALFLMLVLLPTAQAAEEMVSDVEEDVVEEDIAEEDIAEEDIAEEDIKEEPEAAKTVAAAPSTQSKKVLSKSPVVFSRTTQIMHKTLVQDLARVGERIFLAGERGHIGWSDDNGITWQQAKVPTIQDLTALHFVTQELGWAVGHDGNIFNTTDGGKTWTMQLDGLAFNLIRAQARAEKYSALLDAKQAELDEAVAALEAAQDAGKKKTEKLEAAIEALTDVVDELDYQVRDAHKILEEENAPWPLMDVWFADMSNGFAVGAFNAFLVTRDGGKTWIDASDRFTNAEGLHLNVVAGNGSTILIGGEGGLLFRSRDAGVTWSALESPDDGSFYAMQILPSEEPDALEIWSAGLEGAIFHSLDAGDTWDAVEHEGSNNLNSIWVDANGFILMVGNDGAMLRSADNGQTFESHRRVDQSTMSSALVAANGDYILAGATGIRVIKPDAWDIQ